MDSLGFCPYFAQGVFADSRIDQAGQTCVLVSPHPESRTVFEQQDPSQPSLGKGTWGLFLVQATKRCNELSRKWLIVLVLPKNIPNIYCTCP